MSSGYKANKNIEKIKTPYLGKKQGRLLVTEVLISSTGDSDKRRGVYRCTCDCGNTIEVFGTQIKQGKCSCGCLQYEARFGPQYRKRRPDRATYTIQYHGHERSAKERGYIPLDRDTWMSIVTKPCNYCGEIDIRNSILQRSNRKYFVKDITNDEIKMYEVPCNGVDRIDSNIGYELNNIVPCCAQCNYMKIHYPQEQFLKKAEQIHTYTTYNNIKLSSFLCN